MASMRGAMGCLKVGWTTSTGHWEEWRSGDGGDWVGPRDDVQHYGDVQGYVQTDEGTMAIVLEEFPPGSVVGEAQPLLHVLSLDSLVVVSS
jgi:hypothetical protein